MNYFPYIALGLVALLGYWYINNLTNAIRLLESKNSSLQTELTTVTATMDNMRHNYTEVVNALRRYNANVTSMQTSLEVLAVKLSRNEDRLDKLAKQHPETVAKIVNAAVNKRMACLVSASKGLNTAIVNGESVDCNN